MYDFRNDSGGQAGRTTFYYVSKKVRSATYVAKKFSGYNDSWRYSELYYKSKYLYTGSIHSRLSLYQDLLIKRSYHTTPWLWTEEPKDVKQKGTTEIRDKNNDKNEAKGTDSAKKKTDVEKKGTFMRRMWNKFIAYCKHFFNGFKLVCVEIVICVPLVHKYARYGRSSLKRREYMQVIH